MRRTVALVALLAPALTVMAAAPAQAAPTCGGRTATIVGTADGERLVGTSGRDVVVAGGGGDVLLGKGGNDLLCGGPGADRLFGDNGRDRLYGQRDRIWQDRFSSRVRTGDQLVGGFGDDLLHPGPRMRNADIYQPDMLVYSGSRRGVRVDLSTGPATGEASAHGQGADRIRWRHRLAVVGSHHADRLVGADGPDSLVGLTGDDLLVGNGGHDELYPDRATFAPLAHWPSRGGHDEVRAGDGRDDVRSTQGRDVISGDAHMDTISVSGGAGDRIDAGAGGDLLFVRFSGHSRGLEGAVLDGGTHPSDINTDTVHLMGRKMARGTRVTLDAAAGTLLVEAGDVRRSGSIAGLEDLNMGAKGVTWRFNGRDVAEQVHAGSQRLVGAGNGGDDWLTGGPGRNRLRGGDGDDALFGATRADRLRGGPGKDTARGRAGDDHLTGGSGEDRLHGAQGTDTCEGGEHVFGCEG